MIYRGGCGLAHLQTNEAEVKRGGTHFLDLDWLYIHILEKNEQTR